jgi:hypothetical protein
MTSSTYDFRQFQEDLAALDRKTATPAKELPASKKPSAKERMAQAKAEFMALRDRYGLTVVDVVVFFPEEEGLAYLQQLIAEQQAKPKRRSKRSKQFLP